MKQELTQKTQTLERSVGNLFADFLESKHRLGDFKKLSELTIISIDGEFLRLKAKGFPARVSEILKMSLMPSQELKFFPAVAGG